MTILQIPLKMDEPIFVLYWDKPTNFIVVGGGNQVFKPLRFNALLKAVPAGLAHLQLTPQAAQNAKSTTYARVKEQVEVERVRATKQGVKETRVRKESEEDLVVSHRRSVAGHPEEPVVGRRVTKEVEVEQIKHQKDGQISETLTHVHQTTFDVAEVEMTPPHLPREETPIYAKTHRHLVYTLDTPCAICGVRNSTLKDPKENPFGAAAIETHHYPIERSLLNACDPKKVHVIFPQVKDYASLEAFIDSEENMMVLCDIHHRHPHYGIHHILAQDFFIQPFLYKGYEIVAEEEDAAKVRAANERVLKRHEAKTR